MVKDQGDVLPVLRYSIYCHGGLKKAEMFILEKLKSESLGILSEKYLKRIDQLSKYLVID